MSLSPAYNYGTGHRHRERSTVSGIPPMPLPDDDEPEVANSIETTDTGNMNNTVLPSLEASIFETSEHDDVSSSDDDDSVVEADLAQTILHEITESQYVCLICTGEIGPELQIYSCLHCYRVYDLECIAGWAHKDSVGGTKKWRCPACNAASTTKIPKRFSCWCGRVKNPKVNELQPFLCGMLCQYKQPNCVHQCSLMCHPGPHPVCGAMGPMMTCHCGNHTRQWPCLMTPYRQGWKCDDICDTVICDLGHSCGKRCHRGFCGKCKASITVGCYCGNHDDIKIPCSAKQLRRRVDGSVAATSCNDTTRKYYECGVHYEDLLCAQVLEWTDGACPTSPKTITTCPCGKTDVIATRTKCTDPLPTCDNVCGKQLECGHTCRAQCHQGPCQCIDVVALKCQCQRHEYDVPCAFAQLGIQPTCRHKCDALLSCRKHYHRGECCPLEPQALARERERKKASRQGIRSSRDNDIMTIEPVHICTKPCNQLKPCGNHYCEALCHPGACSTCYELSNDDLVCACGKTVVEAPVRCGTKLPPCFHPCTRVKPCGHRPEFHKCHESNDCPKCTFLIEKPCNCGLHVMKGIMCSQERVSCGTICRALKDKCNHPCGRTCSPDCTAGSHVDPLQCLYICNKLRQTCPHRCKLKCHAQKPQVLPDCDKATCGAPVTVTCACGRLSQQVKCGANVTNPLAIWLAPLACDEGCARWKRALELKNAMFGEEVVDDDDNIYLSFVLATYAKQQRWCDLQEKTIREFVGEPVDDDSKSQKATDDAEEEAEAVVDEEVPPFVTRTHEFAPLTIPPQRKFLRDLALAYGLYTESHPVDGGESVVMCLTPSTKVPELTIAEAIARRDAARAAAEELKQRRAEAPFNAVVVQDVFFGISHQRIEKELAEPDVHFEWIKESTCLITGEGLTEEDYYGLMKKMRTVIRDQSLAFDVKMAYVEDGEVYKMGEKLQVKSVDIDVNGDEIDDIDVAASVLAGVDESEQKDVQTNDDHASVPINAHDETVIEISEEEEVAAAIAAVEAYKIAEAAESDIGSEANGDQ